MDIGIGDRQILSNLPDKTTRMYRPETVDCTGLFISCPVPDGVDRIRGLVPDAMARFTALVRRNHFWVQPAFGVGPSDLQQDAYFLLWQREDGYFVLLMPLVGAETTSCIQGDAQGFVLSVNGPAEIPKVGFMFLSTGDDPYDLVRSSVEAVAERLESCRPVTDRSVPAIADRLGWCSWEAFGCDVDARKLDSALASFDACQQMPWWVLIDDGWQQVADEQMVGFDADEQKFPRGLGDWIGKAKRQFGVRQVGVWHTLQGYWHGLSSDSGPAMMFDCQVWQTDQLHRNPDGSAVAVHLPVEDEAHRFFATWYRTLRRQGVDFVKVDNQSGLDRICAGATPVYTMACYQEAIQSAAGYHFDRQLIHCMCHLPQIIWDLWGTGIIRTSDDYAPGVEGSDQWHVFCNAMNSFWLGWLGVVDWDMFFSADPAGEFHAAARAISGGLVYTSDRPGEHDRAVLDALTVHGGRVLRGDRAAMPTADCLFVDCLNARHLLKVSNRFGAIGMLGIFDCRRQRDHDSLQGQFSPSDVFDISGARFAVWQRQAGVLSVMAHHEQSTLALPYGGFELVTISPIHEGVAPLGLLDKYMGPGAIEQVVEVGPGHLLVDLIDGGRVGFYSLQEPSHIAANHEAVDWRFDHHLLQFDLPTGRSHRVVIRFD